jgi:hypothetical protein
MQYPTHPIGPWDAAGSLAAKEDHGMRPAAFRKANEGIHPAVLRADFCLPLDH